MQKPKYKTTLHHILGPLVKKSPGNTDSPKSHIRHLRKRARTKIQIIQFTPHTSIHDSNIHAYIPRSPLTVSRRANLSETKWVIIRVRANLLRIFKSQSSSLQGNRTAAKCSGRLGTEELMRNGTDHVCVGGSNSTRPQTRFVISQISGINSSCIPW